MTERVQIVVEARDQASGILRAIAGQFGQIGNLMQELTSANINWGNILEQGGRLVTDVMKQSIDATTKYAEEVRNLSLVSGQSAEDTSRMLQVLDDFQITADDATTAVRTLTKEGLAPTLETMAQLSDEYLKLNTAQEKNEFILKNLGRSGLQWANMLSKGSAAIRQMGDDVKSSLILTQDNIDAAEEYRLALDNWNDSAEALKITLGTRLLPVLTNLSAAASGNAEALTTLPGLIDDIREAADKVQAPADKAAAAVRTIQDWAADIVNSTAPSWMRKTADATSELGNAAGDAGPKLDDMAEKERAAAEAAKQLSRENQTLLNNMFSLQNASEEFTRGEEQRAAKLKNIEAEKIRLAIEMNDLRSNGELTIERQNDLVAQQLDLESQYQQVLKDGQAALEEKEQAGQRVVYNLLEQKAAADGLVTSDETRFLQDTAVSMGLVDRASADAAIQAAETADAFWQGFQQTGQAMTSLEGTVTASTNQMTQDFTKVQGPMEKTRLLMQKIAAYDGRVIQYGVNFSTSGSAPGSSSLGLSPIGGGRAYGGAVFAGTSYIVGERGPERFVPTENGTIIPNDKARQPVNIYINADVRNLNDLNFFAQEVARRIG